MRGALLVLVLGFAVTGCVNREGSSVCDDCAGCCDAEGRCVGGGSSLECGNGGERCVACGAEETCAALPGGGGECTGGNGGECDPFECDGCCGADGTCQSGLADGACGNGAGSCVACPSGAQCQAWGGGGQCVRLDDCTPFNCDGCCTETGECLSGTSDSACGNGGDRCVACDAPAICESTGVGGGICS